MQFDDPHARLGYRGSMSSRAKDILVKTLAVVSGGVVLASAFVLSLAFFAIALAVVLVLGVYAWWRTRDLRKQMRAQMQSRMHAQDSRGDVIEGVVVSRPARDEDRPRPH